MTRIEDPINERTMVYRFGYRDGTPASERTIEPINGVVGHVYSESVVLAYDAIGRTLDIPIKRAYFYFWLEPVEKRDPNEGVILLF